MTKLLRALALAEVLNVVSIVCIDIGVVKGAVQSKHAVNSTLVYFNLMPAACFSAFNHRSRLSDLFYVSLSKSNLSDQTDSEAFFCPLTFGYLWNTFFLVFRSTEWGEKKEKQNAYNKTENLLMN